MIPTDDDTDVLTGAAPTPEQQRFLMFANLPDDTMTKVGIPLGPLRQMIGKNESAEFGGYNALAWHPNYNPNAMSLPTNANGFPQWAGSKATGKLSHGAGWGQIEPELWNEFAPGMGVTDFSPASQDAVINAIIMRYGTKPWGTNVGLARDMQRYKANPPNPANPLMRVGVQPDPAAMQQAQYFMSGNGGP